MKARGFVKELDKKFQKGIIKPSEIMGVEFNEPKLLPMDVEVEDD